MKKLLSFALVVAMLFSLTALTACDSSTNVESFTKPGTYELTLENASRYVQTVGNGYGKDVTYISKFRDYGYPEIGYTLNIFCPYIFPSEFNDVTITYEVIFVYETRLSFEEKQSVTSDPITVTVTLNKEGTTRYEYTESVEEAVRHNTYCKYGMNPKVASVQIKEISGSITFLPR